MKTVVMMLAVWTGLTAQNRRPIARVYPGQLAAAASSTIGKYAAEEDPNPLLLLSPERQGRDDRNVVYESKYYNNKILMTGSEVRLHSPKGELLFWILTGPMDTLKVVVRFTHRDQRDYLSR